MNLHSPDRLIQFDNEFEMELGFDWFFDEFSDICRQEGQLGSQTRSKEIPTIMI